MEGTGVSPGQITRAGVTLFSDPHYPTLGCAPFVVATSSGNVSSVFDNGLPVEPTSWIDDGRLAALIQTRHSAGLTEQPVTPGIDNLILAVDGASGDAL